MSHSELGRRSLVGFVLCFAGLLTTSWSGPARADDAPKTTPVAKASSHAKKALVAAQAASATLHVTPAALGTSWTYEVTNTDTTPLRIVADGRLLVLDVTPGGEDDDETPLARTKRLHATIHCALPAELRPVTDGERVHVLAPGGTYVEEFDPRLYCFGPHDAAQLVPSSHVVARLGWSGRGSAPPFVVDESFGGEHRSGLKELIAESVVTPDELPATTSDEHPHRLVVSAPSRIDAETGRSLSIDVTVENTTSRPVSLLLRPETLAFEVASPKGVYNCGWGRTPGSVIAEVLTTIAPHGKATTSVLLGSVCPDAAFAKAGLFTVYPRLDTRRTSGRGIGVETFDGSVRAISPTLVRVRRPRAPRP